MVDIDAMNVEEPITPDIIRDDASTIMAKKTLNEQINDYVNNLYRDANDFDQMSISQS